jgi:hypothetical protein
MKRRRISRKGRIQFDTIETMARTVQMMKLRRKLIEIIKKNKDEKIEVDPADWEYDDWVCLIKDRLILNTDDGYTMNRERIELLSTTTQPFTGVPRKAACGDGGIMSLMRTATHQSKLPPCDDPLDKLDDEVQNALVDVNADEMEAVLAITPGQQVEADFFKEFYDRKYKILVDHVLKQMARLEPNKKLKVTE